MYRKSRLEARAARPDELAMLQADLAKDKRWEQVNLNKSIVGVVTKDGEVTTYISARLVWQIEPLKHIYGKRNKLSRFEAMKATFLAIQWMRDWLFSLKNNPLIRSYFCTIRNPTMQKLARSFGMSGPLYDGNKFFGEDL